LVRDFCSVEVGMNSVAEVVILKSGLACPVAALDKGFLDLDFDEVIFSLMFSFPADAKALVGDASVDKYSRVSIKAVRNVS
jgi:hypothetical protein